MQRITFVQKCGRAFSVSIVGNMTNQLFNLDSLKKIVSYSLVTALLIPMTVFGQRVQRTVPNNSSLDDANKITQGQPREKEQNAVITEDVPPNVAPEGGSPCGWTSSTVSPIPILDQGTVTIGTNLYTFAGVTNSPIATANKFNGTTWSPIASVPVALEYPTVVSDGTSAYIINGTNAGTTVNTLYRYNPATNDYTTLAASAAGTSSWNAAGAYLNGKIYKIGGYHGASSVTTSLATVEIYDIATNTWSTGASYPLTQGWESAFAQGSFIYVAGGLDSAASAVPTTKTYRYDPSTNTWDDAAIADLPVARWGAASSQTVYNGGWVLAGGYTNGTANTDLSNTVTEWNPGTNTWSALPNMLQARSRMTGSVLNGAFHVIGGRSDVGGFGGTNDNQRLFCIDPNQPFLQSSVSYVSDNGTPANNVPDPGETVTVSLDIHNIGGVASSNVMATLQNTGGITNPSAPQSYGAINAGATVSRNFTFQVPANAVCGGQITLTFAIVDGATNYTLNKTYTLGVLQVSYSENFDGVTAPALPAGWTTSNTGAGPPALWTTTTTGPDTAPNSAFTNDPASVGESSLESPAIPITSANAQVNFQLHYNTEASVTPGVGYDGTVLEIKIGTGPYQDIISAGGSFVSNGYNRTIDSGFSNPLAGRMAWSGDSATYLPVKVNLPAAANGQSIQLKWRMGSDSSVAVTGVNLDSLTVSGGFLCSTVTTIHKSRADFDGDGKTDLSVFRPSEGNWYLNRSGSGFAVINWGLSGDVLTPGDFDGDGKADTAVFRANADSAQPDFYILNSNGLTLAGVSWGVPGDIPEIADYDGDGKADVAVFRPSDNTWYILKSGGGTTITVHGLAGDVPVAGDFDGDAKADLTVYRSGNWFSQLSGGGTRTVPLGAAGDILVPADYDGDNKDDVAVFRPSTGEWYVLRSSDGVTAITTWGTAGDVPVPGDYDGDDKDDLAIYRNGTWWVFGSISGVSVQNFGVTTDKAIPKAYIP
jgi:hypothetical protein